MYMYMCVCEMKCPVFSEILFHMRYTDRNMRSTINSEEFPQLVKLLTQFSNNNDVTVPVISSAKLVKCYPIYGTCTS
jgi:hypothetical protein